MSYADDKIRGDGTSSDDIAVRPAYDDDDVDEFTPAEQKAIIHRIDRRLVITTGVMYCISLMDRTNLPSAVIAGYIRRCSVRKHYLTSWI